MPPQTMSAPNPKVQKTKKFWSNKLGAKIYRKVANKAFCNLREQTLKEVLKLSPSSLLDIACGPGHFLLDVSNANPRIDLSGTDIAPGMITYAKNLLGEKVVLLESEGLTQPFPDNSFDVVTCMMAFHHLPDKIKTLKEIKRILHPQGTLIITDVVVQTPLQKKLWDLAEKIFDRGFVEHYTEKELKMLAAKTDFKLLSSEHILSMAKRYKICVLK